MNTLLISLIKQENKYIKEFIEYYKNLGVSKIVLYDNNDLDGEHLEEVIIEHIDNSFVEIRDIRGLKATKDFSTDKWIQTEILNKAYQEFKNIYDWILFFDADEFLELGSLSLTEFLNIDYFKKACAIAINWIIYDDNDLLYYEDKPVLERFTRQSNNTINNRYVKIIARGKIDSNLIFKSAHIVTSEKYYVIDVAGNPYIEGANEIRCKNTTIFIKHFMFKTMQEFIQKKKRGFLDFVEPNYYCSLDSFFSVNKRTSEKEELFKTLYNENN